MYFKTIKRKISPIPGFRIKIFKINDYEKPTKNEERKKIFYIVVGNKDKGGRKKEK